MAELLVVGGMGVNPHTLSDQSVRSRVFCVSSTKDTQDIHCRGNLSKVFLCSPIPRVSDPVGVEWGPF